MTLETLRKDINEVDLKMMELFKQRMEISKKIGALKKEQSLPILDLERERQLLFLREKQLNDAELWPLYKEFMTHLMDLSKEHQL